MTTARRDSVVWKLAGLLRESGEWTGARVEMLPTLQRHAPLAVTELQLFQVIRVLFKVGRFRCQGIHFFSLPGFDLVPLPSVSFVFDSLNNP